MQDVRVTSFQANAATNDTLFLLALIFGGVYPEIALFFDAWMKTIALVLLLDTLRRSFLCSGVCIYPLPIPIFLPLAERFGLLPN